MGYLYKDNNIFTAARKGEDGLPVTDVVIKNKEIPIKPVALQEQKTNAHAVDDTVTFSKEIYYVEIYNVDEVNDGVFEVNGIDIYIPAGKTLNLTRIGGTASTNVSVTGSENYIITRYE